MTAQDTPNSPRNSMQFDPKEFFHFLDDTGWSDDQKTEYIKVVWQILGEFVAMGWGVHPCQQIAETCGEVPETGCQTPLRRTDLVQSEYTDLIEEFMQQSAGERPSGENGGIHG